MQNSVYTRAKYNTTQLATKNKTATQTKANFIKYLRINLK